LMGPVKLAGRRSAFDFRQPFDQIHAFRNS
jgi:hypothetical protein